MKLIFKNSFLLLLLCVSVISASSQNLSPTQGWAKTSPDKLNLIADSLIALDRDFASEKYGHVDGIWPQPWLRLQVVAGLLWQQTR
ncbi:hypothetical protein [Haliscomenobacter sp.]|uniref:hypothetical protein n=1 Tax=Haliscomenobacter sp. TaxID=2717303 RepID=UPI003593F8C2